MRSFAPTIRRDDAAERLRVEVDPIGGILREAVSATPSDSTRNAESKVRRREPQGLFGYPCASDWTRLRIQNPGALHPARRQWMLERAVKTEILEERVDSISGQGKPRGVKREVSKFKGRYRAPLTRAVHAWEPGMSPACL